MQSWGQGPGGPLHFLHTLVLLTMPSRLQGTCLTHPYGRLSLSSQELRWSWVSDCRGQHRTGHFAMNQ